MLLFPVDQLPRGFSWEDVAARWSATDSIIPITGRSPVIPQQINTPTGDSGAYRLLDIEMKLFNEASGVSDALLGNDSGGNGGQALYESRVRNSTIALQDTFESFNAFITARDSKIKTLIGLFPGHFTPQKNTHHYESHCNAQPRPRARRARIH